MTPPPAPESRIAAVLEIGWAVLSLGRWRKPWVEPPWGSLTGMVSCWITGGEWPEESIGAVRGGKADGWSWGRGVVGFEGMGDEVVRSVAPVILVRVVVVVESMDWAVRAGRRCFELGKCDSLFVISCCNRFISDQLKARESLSVSISCVWHFDRECTRSGTEILPSLDRKERSPWPFLPLMSVTISVELRP